MLNNNPYYFATTRQAIAVFGSIFKDMEIQRTNDTSGLVAQTIKVPITYAPKERFIARTVQEPDINGNFVPPVVPRMAFEMKTFQYDASRKLNTNKRNINNNAGSISTQMNPVPYSIDIDLYILSKNQEDGLQIIEQIIPFFTPQLVVTVNAIVPMNITYDLPIILKGISFEDNYDGEWLERRDIVWTLSFTLQLNYYGALNTTGSGIIKNTIVNFYSDDALTQKEGSINSIVDPFDASADQAYTINTTFEGFE